MISLNWVSDYIDIKDQNPKELALKITKAGINVEKVITHHIDNLVIGKVIECYPHPDSDHLNVCRVDIGEETLQNLTSITKISHLKRTFTKEKNDIRYRRIIVGLSENPSALL